MTVRDDEKYIAMSLELAAKAKGKTSPNPLVGAVIVRNDRIIGSGYHKKAGTPHAEINAIKNAKESVNGATLYLNLEPCCHHGRTGPCTDAIIENSFKRVVFAMKDPNPKVAGKGAARLRKAGIKVTTGILRKEAERLNETYIKYITTGRPFVILKTAQTLDGRIATRRGDSKWITGEKSRKYVHQLRAEYDAVLVGSTTIKKDNPELTVRHVKGRNPYRIILTGTAQCSSKYMVLKENTDNKTIIATAEKPAKYIDKKYNLIVWPLKKAGNSLSLEDLLDQAGKFGITSILLEGGSNLATSFIKQGLVDKHLLFIAPKLIGDGIPSYGDLNVKKMADCFEYDDVSYIRDFAPDLLFVGYPKKRGRR